MAERSGDRLLDMAIACQPLAPPPPGFLDWALSGMAAVLARVAGVTAVALVPAGGGADWFEVGPRQGILLRVRRADRASLPTNEGAPYAPPLASSLG